MPETQHPSPPEAAESGTLFQVLTSRKTDPGQVYTAIREIESMAGQSVVVQLSALVRTTAAEQTAQFQAAMAELAAQSQATNTRLGSVEKQLGRIWTFLFLILGTLLGTLTTLLTTLLLRS